MNVNEQAVKADQAYFKQTGVMGSYYPYYLHNIQFILYSRTMQGRLAATRAAEKQLQDGAAPAVKVMPEMAAAFVYSEMLAELRMGQWDMPKPQLPDIAAQMLWRYGRTLGFVFKGRAVDARNERAQFEALRKTLGRKSYWGQNTGGDVMDLASVILDARTQSSPAAAVPLWKKAVALQDALTYDEPPAWYYPVRESLGAAMLQAKDAAGAEAVFHEGLKRSPNNGRMLFGLLESLKAQNKAGAIPEVQREFDTAWHGADITLKIGEL